MTLLDCPAYLDDEGARRCGLPAEVRFQFTVRSTDGPVESAMIRCPAGHWFNGPVESLSPAGLGNRNGGTVAAASGTSDGSPRVADGGDNTVGLARRELRAGPCEPWRRPSGAPAYYLGRPAWLWITAMRARRRPAAARQPARI